MYASIYMNKMGYILISGKYMHFIFFYFSRLLFKAYNINNITVFFVLGPGIDPRVVSALTLRARADTTSRGLSQVRDKKNSVIFYMKIHVELLSGILSIIIFLYHQCFRRQAH